MTRKKVIKKKVEVVFDPEKRKEFLTGFRKRKNERRKRAKEELDQNIKAERKRIRQEIKDGMKNMKKSFEPLRELTELDKANEDEYEDDDVKVKIIELSANDLAAQNNLLGLNFNISSEESSGNENDSTAEDEDERANCIPGMDFDVNAKKRKDTDSLDEELTHKKRTLSANSSLDLKSKKDVDRLKKNKTLKQLKKSKVFQMKERFEKKANQKKAKRDMNNTLKSLPRNQRKKKKLEMSQYRKGRLVNKKQLRIKQRD